MKKAYELNKFVDQSIIAMRKRLFEIRCANVKIPNFQIFTINGMVRNNVYNNIYSTSYNKLSTL